MTMTVSSPVTGGAQTGLTSPTYTLANDVAPSINGRQYAVSALGGTQTGVTTSTVSSPFTLTTFRPSQFRSVPVPNPVTGLIQRGVPLNKWSVVCRKGLVPLANQSPVIGNVTIGISIPAGSDSYDAVNVRALLSLAIGALTQISSGVGDTVTTGIF